MHMMATSFAGGTKISMEFVIVANVTGFRVGQRRVYGSRCAHVDEMVAFFPMDQILNGGLVDYILGAECGPDVFVLGNNSYSTRQDYMKYFKMEIPIPQRVID